MTPPRRPTAEEMDAADYFKATESGGDGNECVERSVELVSGWVCVRDSKDKAGPKLAFLPAAWTAFVADLATDQLVPVASE